MARELASQNPQIILGEINWREFEDGFPNLKVVDPTALIDADAAFLADFSSATEIFRQLAVIYALPSYGLNSLKVFLLYFSTGTMDRISEYGEVVTAKTLARMLSVIPAAASSAQIIICDIHALQELHYFSDQVRVRHVTAIDLLLERLKSEKKDLAEYAIAFPDEGAYKRFHHYFAGYELIICEKRRLPDKRRVITIKEGSPDGQRVIVIDDLILSGNTLLECSKVLYEHGAVSVEVYSAHGVCPKESWRKFLAAGIKFYLTDSCPKTIAQISAVNPKPEDFAVISLAPIILKEFI